jgi:hypothetical protein
MKKDKKKVRNLFDSMYKGFPIGYLLVFKIINSTLLVAQEIKNSLGTAAASRMQKKGAKNNQISDDVAEAMVNKMKFDAEQHRKKRDRYNYIKMTGEEEE